jgi:tetratricopeptide (TPR) repeat protein
VITSLNNLAKELARRGQTAEARRLYRQGLEALDGRPSILWVALHNNLAWLEWRAGRSPEAMEQLGAAVRLAGEALGDHHPKRGVLLKNLAVLEEGLGEKDLAEAHYREALEILESTWGKEDPRSRDCRLTLETFLQEKQEAQGG